MADTCSETWLTGFGSVKSMVAILRLAKKTP
jgi:hypothetical protein